jgi:hypothetical protein
MSDSSSGFSCPGGSAAILRRDLIAGAVDAAGMPVRPLAMPALEHDPEKWGPVFGKDHAQTRN